MVAGLLIVEGVLKLPLPRAVRRKGKARLPLPLGVQLDQPRRQLLGGSLGPIGGLGPLGATQLVELGGSVAVLAAGADVLAHQIQRRGGHVQAVAARVGDFDIILFHPVYRQAQHLHKTADAVVGMHHQIAGGQVGIGLQLLAIAVLDPAGLLLLAADALRQLALRQHRQLQRRPLASRADRTQQNSRLSRLGQDTAVQRQRRRDVPSPQQLLHVAGTYLTAAQHHHPIPGGQIMLHIGGRRLQRAAVGAQLPGGDLQQLTRRQQIPAGGQAVHLTQGKPRQLRRRLSLCQRQLSHGRSHKAVFRRSGYVLL